MKKVALITGASAGIGKAIAKELALHEYNLILLARRTERLKELKEEIEATTEAKVLPLTIDISDKEALLKVAENLSKDWQTLDVLVNNAGLGTTFQTVENADLEDWQIMINTNFAALVYVTHAFLPSLLRSADAHIVNIGSVAAKQVKRGSNVYSATKFALEGFTKGLRIDLLEKEVRVSQINPGIVETEFALVRAKGDEIEAKASYAGFTPLYPEDVADAVAFVLSRPKNVSINDIQLTSLIEADINHRLKKIVE